jgi:hypothetical protein
MVQVLLLDLLAYGGGGDACRARVLVRNHVDHFAYLVRLRTVQHSTLSFPLRCLVTILNQASVIILDRIFRIVRQIGRDGQ